jgi:hypothetical protein
MPQNDPKLCTVKNVTNKKYIKEKPAPYEALFSFGGAIKLSSTSVFEL